MHCIAVTIQIQEVVTMHTLHYARKMTLPGYPLLADEAGISRNSKNSNTRLGKAWTFPLKVLSFVLAGCMLGVVMINAQQAHFTDKEELALLQNMATNDENAQLQLGLAYRDGRLGLKQDALQADYWLHRSAAGGNLYAKRLLGMQPQNKASFGSEVRRLLPLQQDIGHLESMAESGDSRAQFELAMRYRDGSWGVERSPDLFREWLEKSAAAGNTVAHRELNMLNKANH
jgi:TPR repeat protein